MLHVSIHDLKHPQNQALEYRMEHTLQVTASKYLPGLQISSTMGPLRLPNMTNLPTKILTAYWVSPV
jgi:hypothetical protein